MSDYDEALERLAPRDLESADGLSSHAPMAAEALVALGHPTLIPALMDLLVPRLPAASTGTPLAEADRDRAIGDLQARADWCATYAAMLAEGDWREVFRDQWRTLLPGAFAAAGHGLLRTVHAVRALAREDRSLRRGELARGLGYWASNYQLLPGEPAIDGPTHADALEHALAALPKAVGGDTPNFDDAARALDDEPAFERAVSGIAAPTSDDAPAFLETLGRLGAGLYCASPGSRILYVHAVTLPAAVHSVLPLLDEDDRGAAAWAAFQCVAAFHALRPAATQAPSPDPEVESCAESWDEIRYRASVSLQEHAIKMAEACLRLDTMAPDPVFRRAAADAAIRLEGTSGSGGF